MRQHMMMSSTGYEDRREYFTLNLDNTDPALDLYGGFYGPYRNDYTGTSAEAGVYTTGTTGVYVGGSGDGSGVDTFFNRMNILPSAAYPLNVGDSFNFSGNLTWDPNYSGSTSNAGMKIAILALATAPANEQAEPDYTLSNLDTIKLQSSSIGGQIGSWNLDYTIKSGFTAGIHVYFQLAIDGDTGPKDRVLLQSFDMTLNP